MKQKINSECLEKVLKSSGILLEHEVYELFMNSFRSDASISVCDKSTVSKEVYSNFKKDYVEVDVYIDCLQTYKNFNYGKKIEAGFMSFSQNDFKVHNVFAVECKGHPSDGFLLVSNRSSETDVDKCKDVIGFVDSNTHRLGLGVRDIKNALLVNWSYFFKSETDRDGNLKGYSEVKEKERKFIKAIRQTQDNLIAVLESMKDSIRGDVCRVVPMIVTNAPICLMNIEGPSVSFETRPWVTYANNFVCGDSYYSNRPEFNHIHIVNSGFLGEWLKIYLSQDIVDLGQFPNGSVERIEGFSFTG